ncbi:AAA family ATPase [Enterococcus quebecensis]|uniref:ATPase AAA-type core domain-containing protein n=1 Tax=Enterococcus quebecensis TaxID=903983 RepID=A0A1E5GT93_9ENTE|nr:ATP-binding protein [Enterococcus quebecensis]OEG15889.1 hypothetical protein BCR23_07005 [Enterococcus quebecensis]OJG72061.1 hypothetical protein RV12_GL001033 [Enterococcus quebecensis]
MLTQMSIENFFSINEKATLSLEHPHSNAEVFERNTVFSYYDQKKKISVVNGAVIYGANASGKTNLLLGVSIIREIIRKSYNYSKKEDFEHRAQSFKFSAETDPVSRFSISFIAEENYLSDVDFPCVKFTYNVAINTETLEIETESLSYQKILKTTLGKTTVIFDRTKNRITSQVVELKKMLRKVEQENLTFKSIASLLIYDINKEYFEKETETFSYTVLMVLAYEVLMGFSNEQFMGSQLEEFAQKVEESEKFKQNILDTLYDFDFAIQDFSITDTTELLVDAIKLSDLPDEIKEGMLERTKERKTFEIKTVHATNEGDYELDVEVESDGTKKFLESSIRVFEALESETLFISDEFDDKYHIKIQEGLLNKFLNQESGKSAQFVVSTHNPLLLNPEMFAKEQIVFVQKNRDTQASEVYQLSEFKEITYHNHSWVNAYLDGRFGAIPEVF